VAASTSIPTSFVQIVPAEPLLGETIGSTEPASKKGGRGLRKFLRGTLVLSAITGVVFFVKKRH
jgi:hypothetical protein